MEKQVFRCQSCRAKLNISGLDSLPGVESVQSTSEHRRPLGAANIAAGGSKVDDSFIFLDHGARKGKSKLQALWYITAGAHRHVMLHCCEAALPPVAKDCFDMQSTSKLIVTFFAYALLSANLG